MALISSSLFCPVNYMHALLLPQFAIPNIPQQSKKHIKVRIMLQNLSTLA